MTHRTKTYRAALIGLGNVAFKYDTARPGGAAPLSQAGALLAHPAVALAGGASPEAADRAAFSQAFGLPAFETPEELLRELAPDIVGICSPTALHYEHASLCLESRIPMVWLEKPACASLPELDALIHTAGQGRSTKLLVNYMRRYEPAHRKLRQIILNGGLGDIISVQVTYSRGLLNNGSHMVDQAFFLLGDGGEAALLAPPTRSSPLNPWFTFRIGAVPVSVVGMDLPYHANDITITGTRARAAIVHGGMDLRLERLAEHELFPGFFRLVDAPTDGIGPADLGRTMINALADLIDAHEAGREPVSNLATARQTQHVIEEAFAEQA